MAPVASSLLDAVFPHFRDAAQLRAKQNEGIDWEALRIQKRRSYQRRKLEQQIEIYIVAYERAVARERARCGRSIRLVMRFETKFGETIQIIGSSPTLGQWDTAHAVPMTWTEGNIWVYSGEFKDCEPFEYKYMKKRSGELVWESGLNHRIVPKDFPTREIQRFDVWGQGDGQKA